MDTGQYLGVFLDEAKEHLQALNDSIMQLEEEPENSDCINEIFRAAHSMKGMAGTMGYKRMQDLTHHIEDVFSDVRNGEIKINSDMVDTLLQCVDAVQAYVDNITETQDEGTEENEHLIKALADIRASKGGEGAAPAAEAAGAAEAAAPEAEMVDPSDDSPTWTRVRLEPAVKENLEEAVKEGKKVIGMTVHILDSCVLKAARAFLVFKGLEEIGEVAMSDPSTQDIEDERFENSFSLLLITEET
ncbi:MAG: Hpt domain-containing protein, partial [Lachnospiraceae bacterium]|nr:Hpt domain-containing protein [Lachnospiraceae bacterium]